MAWEMRADGRGHGWNLDPVTIERTFYDRAWADAMRSRARRVVDEHGIYPDTVAIEFNFRGIREAVRRRRVADMQQFWSTFERDGSAAHQSVVDARLEYVRDTAHVRRTQRQAQHQTARNIDRAVRFGQRGVATATAIRDFSAGTLVIGSAFLTGGASFAVLGGGSLLTGTGTYQDTGNVGAAVLTTATTFAFGLIPLAQGAMVGRAAATASGARAVLSAGTRGERAALFMVGVANDVQSDMLSSLVQGQDARRAIVGALANTAMAQVANRLTDGFFENLAIPVRAPLERARSVVSGAGAGALTDLIVGGGAPRGGATRGAAGPRRDHTRDFAENFVMLFAMSPELDLQPMSGPEFLRAIQQAMRDW